MGIFEKILKYLLIAFIIYLVIRYIVAPLGEMAIALWPIALVFFIFWIIYKKF